MICTTEPGVCHNRARCCHLDIYVADSFRIKTAYGWEQTWTLMDDINRVDENGLHCSSKLRLFPVVSLQSLQKLRSLPIRKGKYLLLIFIQGSYSSDCIVYLCFQRCFMRWYKMGLVRSFVFLLCLNLLCTSIVSSTSMLPSSACPPIGS